MRLSSVCPFESFEMSRLEENLRSKGDVLAYPGVLHVVKGDQDIFYFSYGVLIFWNISENEELEFISQVRSYGKNYSLKNAEDDEFYYNIDKSKKIGGEGVFLPDKNALSKLAVSAALAQSAKLGHFEKTIQKTINETKVIPEHMAKEGKVPLSPKQIRQKMGQLFIDRSMINLHLEFLDAPEFLWDYDEVSPLYDRAAKYLEINERVGILNQRLDVLHEIYEVLNSELQHSHSSRLEWVIIVLIAIEILIVFLKDIFEII